MRHGLRLEIQGLRAVAVLLVVAFHLYPNRVSGGYVGVDVFFVISGYLITSHLLREAEREGRVSLRHFWARRVRRLLPASLLVLAVSVGLALVWLPETLWDQTIRQILASTFYVQNWALAADSVDYMAQGNVPTLVQHFWSLSVEEQFYLGWPVLVGLVAWRVARRPGAGLRRGLVLTISIVIALSLAYSVHATNTDPGPAYFVTTTRIWELGIGALVAVIAVPRVPAVVGRVLGWAGITAVLAAGMLYDGSTAFPGYTALLPVLGTAAVILFATERSWSSPGPWLSLRPATFVGDISYAVYLWHWPLIIIWPHVTGIDLRTRDKIAIFALTILLARLSTRWIEDPIRRSRALRLPSRNYVAAVTAMAVVAVAALSLQWEKDRRDELLLAAPTVTDCLGPGALTHAEACPPDQEGFLVAPATVVQENSDPVYPGCQASFLDEEIATCTLGEVDDPRRTVAIVGDSHATHWFTALDELGQDRGWQVHTYTRSSCPVSRARRVLETEETSEAQDRCVRNNDEVLDLLIDDREIDTVFATSFTSAYDWTDESGSAGAEAAVPGFQAAWSELVDAGKQVVVIRAVPLVKDRANAPDCLMQHLDEIDACALPREDALPEDFAATAARDAGPGVHLLDLTDQFCDDRLCHAVVGTAIVYRDYSHLSQEYSRMLAPYLGDAFDEVDRQG